MTWDYATITSSTPADALADAFETAMTDSTSYSHVEDHTASSVKHRVWNNSGAGFHVILSHADDGTGNLSLRLAESYDSSANTVGYPALHNVSGYVRADYGYAATFGGAATGHSITTPSSFTLNTNTTGFTYLISANSNRVIVATYTAGTAYGAFYAGKFETLLDGSGGAGAVTEPGAFYCGPIAAGSNGRAMTRVPVPAVAGVNSASWSSYQGTTTNWTTISGTPSSKNQMFDAVVLSRVALGHGGTAMDSRGLLYGAVHMTSSTTSYTFGDELEVGGVAKYKVAGSSHAVEMI